MARENAGIGKGVNGDPLETIERIVRVIGRHTEGLFDYHDFGFSRCVIRDHIERVAEGIAALRTATNRPMMDLRAVDRERSSGKSPWDDRQSFQCVAGASMIIEGFREAIRPDDRTRAYAALALLEFEADLLDDVIDADAYTEAEALAFYRHCLTPMAAESFDGADFRTRLEGLVRATEDSTLDLMTSIVGQLHRLLQSSPNWRAVAPFLAIANDTVARGQALTRYQQQPTVDIRALRRGASQLPAPEPDLTWEERLASAAAHGKNLMLVALCFAHEMPAAAEVAARLKAWAYYDLLIAHMNHLVDVPRDTAAGLTNMAVLWMKEADVLDLQDIRSRPPTITLSDYESFLARTAYLTIRALRAARSESDDTDLFYPFITLMIPVVMLYEQGGNGEDLLHTFLRFLAPMVRRELIRDDPFA